MGLYILEPGMKPKRWTRSMKMLLSGAVILQTTGCIPDLLEIVQTLFLGVSAAGALAILNNI